MTDFLTFSTPQNSMITQTQGVTIRKPYRRASVQLHRRMPESKRHGQDIADALAVRCRGAGK